MRKRMYALLLAGVLTFSQSGMIVLADTAENGSEQQIATQVDDVTVTPKTVTVPRAGGSVTLKASGAKFPSDYVLQDEEGNELEENTDYMGQITGANLFLYFNPNEEDNSKTYYLVIGDKRVATITQEGKSEESSITSVTKLSQEILPDGKTKAVFSVKGNNLKEVGVKILNVKSDVYSVERSGEGPEQRVTVTLPKNEDIYKATYNIQFYKTSNTTGWRDEAVTVTVEPAGAETTDPAISGVMVDKSETEWNEGTVNVTVKGTDLTSDLDVAGKQPRRSHRRAFIA